MTSAVPSAASRRAGHRHEDLVAHLVAEPVVDGLEAVEVEHEHGDRARRALPLGQGVGEAVGEQRPVRKAGERVVQVGVGQGLLGRLVLVLVVEEPADAQVGSGPHDVGRAQDLDLVPLAVQQVAAGAAASAPWRAASVPSRLELAPDRSADGGRGRGTR